MNLYF